MKRAFITNFASRLYSAHAQVIIKPWDICNILLITESEVTRQKVTICYVKNWKNDNKKQNKKQHAVPITVKRTIMLPLDSSDLRPDYSFLVGVDWDNLKKSFPSNNSCYIQEYDKTFDRITKMLCNYMRGMPLSRKKPSVCLDKR